MGGAKVAQYDYIHSGFLLIINPQVAIVLRVSLGQ
jgi:hypothetical protein